MHQDQTGDPGAVDRQHSSKHFLFCPDGKEVNTKHFSKVKVQQQQQQ